MKKDLFYCELNPKAICNNCNKCDVCDLDSGKVCNNCGKCIGLDGLDYSKVLIEGILDNEEEVEDYTLKSDNINEIDLEESYEYDYIEDIPELRDEYERRLDEILRGSSVDTECSHQEHEEDDCGCCYEHS